MKGKRCTVIPGCLYYTFFSVNLPWDIVWIGTNFNRSFPRCFQVLIKTNKRISSDKTGKSALKLVHLRKLKVILGKRAKILLYKVAEFYRRLYGAGTNLLPTIQTSVKFRGFAELHLR